MSLKQFNCTYVNQEDRILLRFNTVDQSEYRLWLTRYLTKGLLEASSQLIQDSLRREHSPEVAKAIESFEHETVKQSSNLATEYEGASHVPLGENPLLINALSINYRSDQVCIDLQLANNQSMNIQLPILDWRALIVLIDEIQRQASWGIETHEAGFLFNSSKTH